ncbi:MAG: hypothetical protein ACXVEF_06995 [Polyangiales bacterium]
MRALFLALALAISLPAAACAKHPATTQEGAVDEVLLAWLSSARALHHQADLQEDQNDLQGALVTLERLLNKPKPRNAPEIDEVLSDTRGRMADIRSRLGDFDGAAKDVEAGLALSTSVSYYRGHLLEVRGLVEERRSKALALKGDLGGAAKARQAAMKAYEEAIAVQDEFIKKSAEDSGK